MGNIVFRLNDLIGAQGSWKTLVKGNGFDTDGDGKGDGGENPRDTCKQDTVNYHLILNRLKYDCKIVKYF